MMPKKRPPDLDHCIQILQSLLPDLSSKPAKSVAEVYTAAIGLLYHLKLDQVTLLRIHQRASKDNDGTFAIPFPKSNAIPAITAVIHNQTLFKVLISCLSNPKSEKGEPYHDSGPGAWSLSSGNGRKRSSSFDASANEKPSKLLKVSHSPQVAKRTSAYGRPDFNIPVLAATILFCTFEYYDHWPVALVRVYAEDSFGPRRWVDEAACQLLVQNLSLAHSALQDEHKISDQLESDALTIVAFYNSIMTPTAPLHSFSGFSVDRREYNTSPQSSLVSNLSEAMIGVVTDNTSTSTSVRSGSQSGSVAESKGGNNSDAESDSGDEEEIVVATPMASRTEDDVSSSSGEEDEEVVMSTKSIGDESIDVLPNTLSDPPPTVQPTYPISPQSLNFQRIRMRYFGQNLQAAQEVIHQSLRSRLEVRSKQNSGLLQALPSFASVPQIRKVITNNLEKWLQSPALAGLARSLFSHTVSMIKNADPPLEDDLQAMENIILMRLKANQLSAHIENVTAIAKRVPTTAVARHMYHLLIQEMLHSSDKGDASVSDYLKMVSAIHKVIPCATSSQGMAEALLHLSLGNNDKLCSFETPLLVERLRNAMRSIAREIGASFDVSQLLRCLITYRQPDSYTRAMEENKARLLFQCAMLLVGNPKDATSNLKSTLLHARKHLLRWCCNDYVLCFPDLAATTTSTKKKDEVVGAGSPDFKSILDGINTERDNKDIQSESGWLEQAKQIDRLHEFGGDLDEETVRIVLGAKTRSRQSYSSVAIPLLEHLFYCCSKQKAASMSLSDPSLLWELYDLVEYVPDRISLPSSTDENDVQMEEADAVETSTEGTTDKGTKSCDSVQRLAYPGLWWRVTALALIMCGNSPGEIGATAWESHPTLNTLMKMVTSDRYKFPTVDCDDHSRDEMKKTEQTMRDEEARVAELLFLPAKPQRKKIAMEKNQPHSGSRVSKRQQAKRERELQQQKEKEKREIAKQASKRKKRLRLAQKSIMLWDPREGPRKPPKESADLIFSVGDLFDLPQVFRKCTTPDYVLSTIGNTSRDSIERAHDWLIPIISYVPETISRLPASASCFLLLRAYGTDGEDSAELHKLSAPLLKHVHSSLTGDFGETNAVRAFELLLAEVASHNPDRRRCARRVFHEAIGPTNATTKDSSFANTNCTWMINLLHVQHVNAILRVAIAQMTLAASYERGRVLRFLVLALEQVCKFAEGNDSVGDLDFPTSFMSLVSNRPTVFGSTMTTFPDLLSLGINVVHNEFERIVSGDRVATAGGDNTLVKIRLCVKAQSSSTHTMPLALLQTACVILSIWHEESSEAAEHSTVKSMVQMLLKSENEDGDQDIDQELCGLASAQCEGSVKDAVPVESWVMLAKSRSNFVARCAALTAPPRFLPRLLLCSGVPRSSLITMIDRSGKLGDKSADKEKTYKQLMIPSATSEWDIGRLEKRKQLSKKLLGRLMAYNRMFQLQDMGEEISFTFLDWLKDSCNTTESERKPKSKKSKQHAAHALSGMHQVKTLMEAIDGTIVAELSQSEDRVDEGDVDMTKFLKYEDPSDAAEPPKAANDRTFVKACFEKNEMSSLVGWLNSKFGDWHSLSALEDSFSRNHNHPDSETLVSSLLLESFADVQRKKEVMGSVLLKWIPRLTKSSSSPSVWSSLFAKGQKPSCMWNNLIARCCQTWSRDHVLACRTWILTKGKLEDLECKRLVRFLLLSSDSLGIHITAFDETRSFASSDTWTPPPQEASISRCIHLSLECIEDLEDDTLLPRLCSRNDLPNGLIVLLLICKSGKRELERVAQTVVQRLNTESEKRKKAALLATILRLYACFPNGMNLGVAVLRECLKTALVQFGKAWTQWRSPLDDVMHDLIDKVNMENAPARLVSSLIDHAKRHPLLVLRMLKRMEEVLETDAMVKAATPGNEKRGVLYAHNLSPPAPARVAGKSIKVTVKHWGYNYTESLWIAFLDVAMNIHNEVLYDCALKVGLLEFLGAYLRLTFVQSQLQASNHLPRLKEKLSIFFTKFQASNISEWDRWLTQPINGLTSLGAARNVLMSCEFISHQQAIDNVKKSRSEGTKG